MNSITTHIKNNKTEIMAGSRRVLSVDALRGLTILLMILSAVIPFGVLPSWMYHAQSPPPLHHEVLLPGITWVDLIFPFFLFTMGISIPLALEKKLSGNIPLWKIIFIQLKRSILLAIFAIYIYHINPNVISSNPDWKTWLLSITGFVLLFPVLGRFPFKISNTIKILLQYCGLLVMVLFIVFLHWSGAPFSLYHSDIIILVLANVSFFGSIIWLVSRGNFLLRISFIGFYIALRLSSSEPGWVYTVWNYSPVPWLYNIEFLKYLLIIIPGTIIGDFILKYQASSFDAAVVNKKLNALIVFLAFILTVAIVSGLKLRLGADLFILAFFLSLLILQIAKMNWGKSSILFEISVWGFFWLILGMLLEPFEGGIKKDPSTLSYYFITSGLAAFILAAFYILIDVLNKKKYFNLLIDCGRNPLIAYAGLNSLVFPVLFLLYIKGLLDLIFITPWLGALEGLLITYLLALITRVFSKNKIFLTA